MEKHTFYATLSANVELSDSDFNLLLESAKNHYDHTVNSTVQVGGFLYGFKNRRDFSKGEDKIVEFSERELGLTLKSLEMQNSDKSNHLAKRLYDIAIEMQKKQVVINKSLNS